MGDLGHLLKASREHMGLSLEDLSRQTRIPVRILAALEEERFEEWPQEVFIRGFVQSWCQVTGLDREIAARHLQEALQRRPLPSPRPPLIPILPVTGSGRSPGWKAVGGQWAYLGVLLVLVLGLLAILLTYRGSREDLSRAAAPMPGYQRTVPIPMEVN